MIELLHREGIYLWYYFTVQFEQIFQYWVMGVALGSVLSVFGKQRMHRLLTALHGKKWGLLGVIPASIIGIASPLCMYGTVPVAASFSEKGIQDDWLAAFMMSSILLNPQLILYSAALGVTALVVRVAACFLCGIAAGLCVRLFYASKGKPFFNFAGFVETDRDTDPRLPLRLLKNIYRNVKATGPYFLLGIGLSAVFQRYVPESLMVSVFGSNKAFGLLMAATIGVPLYACGGGTIPLLQGWLQSGMSLGSATAFMITGPATKITNLGAVKIVLGMKRFVLYVLFSLAFAFLFGLLVDLIL